MDSKKGLIGTIGIPKENNRDPYSRDSKKGICGIRAALSNEAAMSRASLERNPSK